MAHIKPLALELAEQIVALQSGSVLFRMKISYNDLTPTAFGLLMPIALPAIDEQEARDEVEGYLTATCSCPYPVMISEENGALVISRGMAKVHLTSENPSREWWRAVAKAGKVSRDQMRQLVGRNIKYVCELSIEK